MENLNIKSFTKITFTSLFCGLLFSFSSCIEEEPKIIPDVYVNFTVNISLPEYNTLNSINNSLIYSNEGYDENGVIIYRYTLDEFFAFDATCPQHILNSTSVTLDDSGAAGTATCPECGTTYFLVNFGYPENGYPLKRYNVFISGNNLTVSNVIN